MFLHPWARICSRVASRWRPIGSQTGCRDLPQSPVFEATPVHARQLVVKDVATEDLRMQSRHFARITADGHSAALVHDWLIFAIAGAAGLPCSLPKAGDRGSSVRVSHA